MAITRKVGVAIADLIDSFRDKSPGVADALTLLQNSFNDLWGRLLDIISTLDNAGISDIPGTSTVWLSGAGAWTNAQTPWNADINGNGFKLTTTAKGSQFGAAAGNSTAPADTDANVLLFHNNSTSWAGIGSDANGDIWFRSGSTGSSPDAGVVIEVNTQRVGIGTVSPTISGTGLLHVAGDTARIFPTSRTPANSAAAGNDGEICADSNFVYVHTGGSWRRVAVATF